MVKNLFFVLIAAILFLFAASSSHAYTVQEGTYTPGWGGPGIYCNYLYGRCTGAPNVGRFVCFTPPHAPKGYPCNEPHPPGPPGNLPPTDPSTFGFDPINSEATGDPSVPPYATVYLDHSIKTGNYTLCDQTVQLDVMDSNNVLLDSLLWYTPSCPTPPTPTPTPTTGPTLPPSAGVQLGQLQINQSPNIATTFSGVYGLSGNLSGQQGQNWLNPVLIKLDAATNTPGGVTQLYVAMYKKSLGSVLSNKATFLTDVKNLINSSNTNGILLLYDATAPSGSRHKVWDGQAGNWQPLQNFLTSGYDLRYSSGIVYTVYSETLYSVIGFPVTQAAWQVMFSQSAGGDYYTAGYAVDASATSFNSDMIPH